MIHVCIPAFPIPDWQDHLTWCLSSIYSQKGTEFRVLIADQSGGEISEHVRSLDLGAQCYSSPAKSSVQNAVFAMSLVPEGEICKFLFMDDHFTSPDALYWVEASAAEGKKWGALGTRTFREGNERTTHKREPKWSCQMPDLLTLLLGTNPIGSPSVVWFRRGRSAPDPNLSYLWDTEFYFQLFMEHGIPALVPMDLVGIQQRAGSISAQTTARDKERDIDHIIQKHLQSGPLAALLKKYQASSNRDRACHSPTAPVKWGHNN